MYMRIVSIVLLLLFCGLVNAQTGGVTVSMAGIGDIKVGLKKEQLEKLTGRPIKLVNLLKKDEWQRDTVKFTYKDIPYEVVLDKDNVNETSQGVIVYEVRSSGAGLKTKSGIAIGDDKLKIVSTYNDYMMHIMPDWENNYTVKSKTRSIIMLFGDESSTVITFYLTDGKVTSFSVGYSEGC